VGGAASSCVSGPKVFTDIAFEAASSGLQLATQHMYVATAAGAVFQVDYARCSRGGGGGCQHGMAGQGMKLHTMPPTWFETVWRRVLLHADCMHSLLSKRFSACQSCQCSEWMGRCSMWYNTLSHI
jgi:hypothetical protein